VRAGVRNWSSAARLSRFPVEIALCNIMEKTQIAQAMRDVTCVIHCAKDSRQVIIQGTKNVLDVAQELRINRFIHLSTSAVYGNQSGEISETYPYQYTGSLYGDSKIEAEKLCWEYYKRGLPVTIIRPSIVYGPFSKDWTLRLAQSLKSGNWGIFKGIGEGVCNLIYISDLVSGILLALRHEAAVGEAFNLAGPELISWNQYFQKFNAALGLPELRIFNPGRARLQTSIMKPVRSSAKFILAHFSDPLKKISQKYRFAREVMKSFEKTMRTSPRLEEFSLYGRNAVYLGTKAQDMIGFKPEFNVEKGLRLSVGWLKHHGLLDL